MATSDDIATREERLAAKLRENLRRRKSQSREMAPRQMTGSPPPDLSKPDDAS